MGFLKKVLKVVAIVAAVALAIPTGGTSLLVAVTGLSAIGATALVAGLTIASGLLNKPKVPNVSSATVSRLNTSIDPRTPRKIVFGQTAMAVDIRDMEYTGTDDEFLHYFLVNAAHEITGFDAVYFDDKLAWSLGGGIDAEFIDYLGIEGRAVGTAGNAINISARMGTTRRFTGLAYVWLRFKRTGVTEKAESPFSASIPSRITVVGRGIKCYDPRQDSTVPGGSGSHRSNNQATWTWGDHARNPAIQLLTYLLGWRINGRLSVGKGIPVARLHLPSFMTAANICDEPIALAGGGTQPRYRSDGIFSEADDMGAVIDSFKAAMAAEVDDSDGRFAIRLLVNDLDDPIAHFGPDDFLSGLTWSPIADISSRFNVIRGQFVDPRPESLYQMVDYPEVSVASVDGIERAHSFPLGLVQDPSQAQRTAKQLLQRQQYSGLLEVTTGHTGWRVQKYDIVTITHPPLGFYAKLFRVAAMGVGTHGAVQFTLREENEAIYAWDEDESAPVDPAAVTTYVPSNNPLVAGIGGALVAVVGPQPPILSIEWDWTGVLVPGQLPITLAPSVLRDGVDIRTDDDVDYSVVLTGGLVGNVTLNNTDGSAGKGNLTFASTITASGTASLLVNVAGIDFGPFLTTLHRINQPPPGANAVGGGSDATLATVTTTSFAAMTGQDPGDAALDVTITGTSDTIRLTANFSYNVNPISSAASIGAKGQYYNGSTWVDMTGGEIFGTDAEYYFDSGLGRPVRIAGAMAGEWTVTALAAGTYPVRLVGRASQSGVSLLPFGGSAISSKI